MTKQAEHYENVKCLPKCDEQHAEGCPRFEAEKEYWRWYFQADVKSTFWGFKPADCKCGPDYQADDCPRHGRG